MLKSIIKTALIATMVLGTSSAVMAESPIADAQGLKPIPLDSAVRVNVRYAQYFGQYNSGKEGEAAHFKNYGETGVQFSGGVGNARFFVDTEARSGAQYKEYFDVVARASYITPVGLVSIGKVSNYMAYPLVNAGGGIKGSNGNLGAQNGSTLAGAIEDDGIDLMIPLMDNSLIIEATMWDKAAVKFRTWDMASRDSGALAQSNKGSAQALGVMYKTDIFTVKAGQTTETMDDYTIDTDTAETNSYNQVSAGVNFGNMSVNAGMVNVDIKNFYRLLMSPAAAAAAGGLPAPLQTFLNTPGELKAAVTVLGFTMKNLGPGTLNINYEAVKFEDSLHDNSNATVDMILGMSADAAGLVAALDFNKEATATSLIYTIEISEKIGYQIIYDTKAATPEGGDTVTSSFIGAGLFGFF